MCLSSSQVGTRDGRTFTHSQEFLQGIVPIKHTYRDPEKGGNEASLPENKTENKINSKSNKKNLSKKRKNKGKESTDAFIFPKKTARPISPTSTQDPIETNNNFSELTSNLQSKMTSTANVSCTPIGPPLPKSRPPLLTQVSKTVTIRVPDRGLWGAGAA
ncbi:hypothetical protein TNCV_105801 [Trichonephila clavipes]|nr:hypothetical protein TNCV_105801 [Trichonephila clavipes]